MNNEEVKPLTWTGKELRAGEMQEYHVNGPCIIVGMFLGRWLELWIAVGTLPCSLNEFSS